jgi:hypothetical protein
VATLAPDSDEANRIDASLREWRQGDLALEESWFVHVGDGALPLSEAAAEAESGVQSLTSEVLGLVVVTQTCDIVRSCVTRPYIEVAPLVRVSEDDLHQVKRGRRPAQASLPTLEKNKLVVDLDRVMTVEKSIVASWNRTPGFARDADGRAFSLALARKRARVAFPDDFVAFATPLMRRMTSKHGKQSDEGRALRALREIRVRAEPSWDADHVKLVFWFIRNKDEATFENQSWDRFLDDWKKRIQPSGRFVDVQAVVQALDDLTAREYVESDPLDLDYLTTHED